MLPPPPPVVVLVVVVRVVLVALVVVVVVAPPPPVKAQEHSLEIALGLFEHAVAHAGKAVVAVTADLVKVAQKAEAVAACAVINEAQGSESGLVHALTKGTRARRA